MMVLGFVLQTGQMLVYVSGHDENGPCFLWFSKCHFAEHVSPQEPPIVSRCPLMAEQQVNGVHMEKGCCQRVNN